MLVCRFADAARYAAVTGRELVDNLANELAASRRALAGIRSDSAAWKILRILTERTGFSRNRVWEQREILGVLDAYAAQIRRAS